MLLPTGPSDISNPRISDHQVLIGCTIRFSIYFMIWVLCDHIFAHSALFSVCEWKLGDIGTPAASDWSISLPSIVLCLCSLGPYSFIYCSHVFFTACLGNCRLWTRWKYLLRKISPCRLLWYLTLGSLGKLHIALCFSLFFPSSSTSSASNVLFFLFLKAGFPSTSTISKNIFIS